nr:auxin response factor 6-like isoform X1 [Tanacetum cinerariifolium]
MNPIMTPSSCLDESGFLQSPDNADQTGQTNQPNRIFVKVYKSGSFGRSLDIGKFSSYHELRSELGQMFGLEGQLEDPLRSGWQLVFVDRENDVLLLGDDPWPEFVSSVYCIKILSPQEMQEMGKQGLELLNSVPIRKPSDNGYENYAPTRQESMNLSNGVASVGSMLNVSGVVVVNMKNYEDEPVTLTCRSKLKLIKLIRAKFRNTPREELFRNTCFGWLLDLDDSQENCVLIHFMSCRQVERSPEDTVVVPLTYHINGHYIEFGWEEFCLITGLRFGPKFSERCEVGLIPFRRLLFDSDTYGGHVTGKMLVVNINSEEFDNLHDEVAIALCQLAVLHLVLLGCQLAHNIPDWWMRLIDDKKTWKIYPWGSLVWAQLYDQLENANETWILETYNVGSLGYYTHQQHYPRVVAWSKVTTFQRKFLPNFFDGARPNQRLRPNAFEAKAEWWVRSREFFDGRIHEAPPIPTPKKNDAHEKLLKEVYKFYQGLRQDRPKTFTKQTSSSFFDMVQRTSTYPKTFEESILSRHHTSYLGTPQITTLQGFAPWSSTNQARLAQNPGTPHIATPMAQHGFSLWSCINQAGPSQNHDDEMLRGKRETFPSKYQLSPFTCMPTTKVAPKKRANNIRNKTMNTKVSAFNLGKASIDLNSSVEDLFYMGSRDTDVYISLHNADPNKVVRNKYVDCMSFLESSKLVFLDCGIKGFVVEERFWRDLVPYVCKGGNYTENKYVVGRSYQLLGGVDDSR